MNNRLVRLRQACSWATLLVGVLSLVSLASWAVALPAHAQTAVPEVATSVAVPDSLAVPESLEPWVGWALGKDVERLTCTRVGAAHECGWPLRLTLDVRAEGGRFELEVWRDSPGSVALPGGGGQWPLDVTVDGAVAVVAGSAQPTTRVGAGAHRVEGRLPWSEVPQVLSVPSEVALVTLQRDGVVVATPRRDADGRVWIAASGGGEERAETDTVIRARAPLASGGRPTSP